jgi:hypothetical protein
MSQLIILGWDALDGALIERYGLADQFGSTKNIETYANPVVGEPHTLELWPSMITGLHSDEHGIKAATEEEGVDWDSTALSVASHLAAGIVPQDIRTEIGRRLRERIGLNATTTDYYTEQGIRTVFDSGGRAISIPNYQTDYDETHGLDAMRNDVWQQITPDRSVAEGIEPQVSLETVWETLSGAAGDRVGHTLASIQQGHDLVWTWFGVLDTIGHIQPAMAADLEERGYRMAASMTQLVREVAPADATVVAISDHGLQCGEHTDYATLATDEAGCHEHIDSVLDVADWVEQARSGADAQQKGYEAGEVEALQEDLEALGYV